MPFHPPVVAVTSAALLTALLAGCSTAAGPSGAAGSPSAGPGTPPPSSSPAPPGMTALPAACPADSLLESDLGLTVVSRGGANIASCVYTGVGTIVSINFALKPGMTSAQAEAAAKAQGTTPAFQAVPGVGTAAFYDAPSTGGTTGSYIVVLSGQVAFHIVTTSEVSVDKMAKAARDIIATD